MPFCPRCGAEYRSGFERCVDCDVRLMAHRPRPQEPSSLSLRRVHTTLSLIDAHMIRSMLAERGIDAVLENEFSSMVVIGLPTTTAPIHVVVPETQVQEALHVLDEIQNREASLPPESDASPTPAEAASPPRRRRWTARALWMLAGLLVLISLRGAAPALAMAAWGIVSLVLLLHLRDRHPFVRVPGWRLMLFFAYGNAVAVPLALIGTVSAQAWLGIEAAAPLGAFLVIGPLEEAVKLLGPLCLVGLVSRWKREPYEWFLACAASGAGFATTENVIRYCALMPTYRGALLAFALGAPSLLHIALSASVGFGLGVARGRPGYLLATLLVLLPPAALVHGLWDALCLWTAFPRLLLVLLLGLIVLPLFAALGWAIRKLAERSPSRPAASYP